MNPNTNRLLTNTVVLLILVSMSFGQSIEDMMRGPILGYTYIPDEGQIDISAQMVSVKFNSSFDESGTEISFNDDFDGIADPEFSFSYIDFSGDFRINREFGVSVSVPFYTEQTIDWNPAYGYEEYFRDMSGETGLGDVIFGAWYQLALDSDKSIQSMVSYQLATGSSPEDVSESSASSTGSGHTAIKLRVGADFLVNSRVLISGVGSYSLNQEATLSSGGYSWDSKEGNSLFVSWRAKFVASPQLGLAADFDFYSSGEDEIDGETISDSDVRAISITPMVGYKFSHQNSSLNLTGGYILNISGKNIAKMNGLILGVTAFF